MKFYVVLEDGSVGVDDLPVERWFARGVEHVASVISVGLWIQVPLLLDDLELFHVVLQIHCLDEAVLLLLQVGGHEASVLGDSVSVPVVCLVICALLVELAGGVQRWLLRRAKTEVGGFLGPFSALLERAITQQRVVVVRLEDADQALVRIDHALLRRIDHGNAGGVKVHFELLPSHLHVHSLGTMLSLPMKSLLVEKVIVGEADVIIRFVNLSSVSGNLLFLHSLFVVVGAFLHGDRKLIAILRSAHLSPWKSWRCTRNSLASDI